MSWPSWPLVLRAYASRFACARSPALVGNFEVFDHPGGVSCDFVCPAPEFFVAHSSERLRFQNVLSELPVDTGL